MSCLSKKWNITLRPLKSRLYYTKLGQLHFPPKIRPAPGFQGHASLTVSKGRLCKWYVKQGANGKVLCLCILTQLKGRKINIHNIWCVRTSKIGLGVKVGGYTPNRIKSRPQAWDDWVNHCGASEGVTCTHNRVQRLNKWKGNWKFWTHIHS